MQRALFVRVYLFLALVLSVHGEAAPSLAFCREALAGTLGISERWIPGEESKSSLDSALIYDDLTHGRISPERAKFKLYRNSLDGRRGLFSKRIVPDLVVKALEHDHSINKQNLPLILAGISSMCHDDFNRLVDAITVGLLLTIDPQRHGTSPADLQRMKTLASQYGVSEAELGLFFDNWKAFAQGDFKEVRFFVEHYLRDEGSLESVQKRYAVVHGYRAAAVKFLWSIVRIKLKTLPLHVFEPPAKDADILDLSIAKPGDVDDIERALNNAALTGVQYALAQFADQLPISLLETGVRRLQGVPKAHETGDPTLVEAEKARHGLVVRLQKRVAQLKSVGALPQELRNLESQASGLREMARTAGVSIPPILMELHSALVLKAIDTNDPDRFDAHVNEAIEQGMKSRDALERVITSKDFLTAKELSQERMQLAERLKTIAPRIAILSAEASSDTMFETLKRELGRNGLTHSELDILLDHLLAAGPKDNGGNEAIHWRDFVRFMKDIITKTNSMTRNERLDALIKIKRVAACRGDLGQKSFEELERRVRNALADGRYDAADSRYMDLVRPWKSESFQLAGLVQELKNTQRDLEQKAQQTEAALRVALAKF